MDNGSKPPIGYLPPKTARSGPKPTSAEGGIIDAIILIAFATYELPVAMLTRTHKGARYARLLRLLLGLLVGSFAYSACDPLSEYLGIVAKLGRDARTPTGPNLYFVLWVLSLVAYAVAAVRRWGRGRRREFVHSQFIGFPRFLPPAYASYLIEPAAVAVAGAVLIVTRVSYPFGLYLGSVAVAMLVQFAVNMARRRDLILDLRDSELVQHGLRHVDPTDAEASRAHAAVQPTSSEELMRVFRM